jgi:hypothetical protein
VNTRERVAYRYLYARLLLAMSMDEAKQVLGFPPTASPTPQEISKAYKEKAFKNHPDRGGDPTKMVEINVAKDVLEGKGKPGRARPDPGPAYTKYEPPPPPPPVEGKSFSQAFSEVPGGVDWKFVSSGVFSSGQVDAPTGKVTRHFVGYIVYGQTESHHVFVGVQSEKNPGFGRKDTSVAWKAIHGTAPRAVDLLKLAPKMVVDLVQKMAGWETVHKYNIPKKFKVLNGAFDEKDLAVGAGLSLKDAIIGSGAMPADASGLKGRKLVVTVEPKQTKESYQAYKDHVAKSGRQQDTHKAYVWTVEVNGRGRTLSEEEVDKLVKNLFMIAVFSYDYSKGKKNLANLRGGPFKADAAMALERLHDALQGGPLKEQVGQAAEQAVATKKKEASDLVYRFITETDHG